MDQTNRRQFLHFAKSTWAPQTYNARNQTQRTKAASDGAQYTSSPTSKLQSRRLDSEPEQLSSPTGGVVALCAASACISPEAVPTKPIALHTTDTAPALIPHTGDHLPPTYISTRPSAERLGAPSAVSNRTEPSALRASGPQ